MTNWRKGYTFLLMGLMITSGLVAFAAPVIADTVIPNTNNRFRVDYTPATMYEEMVYDVDGNDGSYFLLGEGDGLQDDSASANTLTLTLVCVNNWPEASNICVNITSYTKAAFDFADADPATSDIPGGVPWVGPAANNTGTNTYTWNFDVLKTSGLGTATDTEVTMRVWYSGGGSGATGGYGTFTVRIYLSSIFDDPATEAHVVPNMVDINDDGRFEAGDNFEASQIALHNYDDANLEDLTCWLSEPGDGVTLSGGRSLCRIPGGINTLTTVNASYRTDVAAGTEPGEYWGTAVITYSRLDSDLTVNETSLDILWEVDFNFRDSNPYDSANVYSEYQCRATDVTITDTGEGNTSRQTEDWVGPSDTYEQSTFSDKLITVEVVIENNANHPIYNAEFVLDPATWPNFRNPRFFWVSAGTLSYDNITVTGVDLAIGGTVTFVIEVIVVKEIPIGEHRLPILYDGFYFNDGSLGEPTGFHGINGGNGVVDAADDLEVIFGIVVTDGYLDCHVVPPVFAGDKGKITSEVIAVNIVNDEGYTFIDILVTADFTGTPFYAPLIDSTTLDWPVPTARNYVIDAQNANMYTPFATWGPNGTMNVTFLVDTDPNMVPDRYPFSLTITAIINNTLVQVTTTVTVGAEIEYAGYGPIVYVTGFTSDDIVPGDYFDLVLTIENQGDDTIRDVWVIIPPDGTIEYDWNIVGSEADFKDQFNWSNVFENWVEVHGPIDFPDGMFYTMESLDVDNIREIIEINLYIEGVYSDPGSTVNLIHIIDLAPGASFDVTFIMIADKDMVNGKPYNIVVWINGIDSEGDPYNLNQTLEVMTSLPGDHYNPVELDWFTAGMKALALFLFFIIILAILLLVYNRFKGEPGEEEEEEFDFEDEPGFEETPEPVTPESPPEPPAPEPAPEELVEP